MRGSANLFCTTDNFSSTRAFGNSYFKKYRQDDVQNSVEKDEKSPISRNALFCNRSQTEAENSNFENQKLVPQFIPSDGSSGRYQLGAESFSEADFSNKMFHVPSNYLKKDSLELSFPENAKRIPIQTMARQQYRNYNLGNPENGSRDQGGRYPGEALPKYQKNALAFSDPDSGFIGNLQAKEKQVSNLSDSKISNARDSTLMGDFPQGKLNKKLREKLDPKLDALLELVENQEMNSISLLNEMSGKLKKKVEYDLTEGLSGRTKIFDCTCLFGNQVIGKRRGNTKQSAKAEAAKQGLRTLLTEKQFLTESAALILSIQKAQENMTKQRNPLFASKNLDEKPLLTAERTPSEEWSTSLSLSSINQEKSVEQMKSSLYELNVLARRLSIEPIWSFPFEANAEGYFEVSLQFGNLMVTELAKRKQDAKKEAAALMIKKIKEAQSENKTFHSENTENIFGSKNQKQDKGDKARLLFEKMNKPRMVSGDNKILFKQIPKKISEEQTKMFDGYELKSDVNQSLEDFFHRIENYTSMITSNPKQIMLEEKRHLADYIKSSYLSPVGSFALGCMRKDKLVIDTILTYEEIKSMEEEEFLELYKYSLETCFTLDQQAGTNIENMKFCFSVQEGGFLQIKSTGRSESLCLNIYIQKHALEQLTLPIQHIHKIYSQMNDGSLEELKFFRKLLQIIRMWRSDEFNLVPIEIFDMVLLTVFLRDHSFHIEKTLFSWTQILNSSSLTARVLKSFGQQYLNLYEELSQETKDRLHDGSRQMLSYISSLFVSKS